MNFRPTGVDALSPISKTLWEILQQRGTKFSILSPILSDFDQILLKCSY